MLVLARWPNGPRGECVERPPLQWSEQTQNGVFFFSTTLYLALLLTSFHNHIHTMGVIFRLLLFVPPLGGPDPAVSQVRDNWHLTCRWGARNSAPPQILNPVAMTESSVKLNFSVDEFVLVFKYDAQ